MSKRPAVFTEAEMRRAMKAAAAEGFDRVEFVVTSEGRKIVFELKARGDEPEPFVREFEV